MNKNHLDIIKKLNTLFQKAPSGFCHSDNSEILTHENISLRKLSQSIGIPCISNKELVFRKFYELRNLSYAEQANEIQKVVLFLSKYDLDITEISRILDDITIEINEFSKSSGRIIFNPFS
jgi:hypothetical protein